MSENQGSSCGGLLGCILLAIALWWLAKILLIAAVLLLWALMALMAMLAGLVS